MNLLEQLKEALPESLRLVIAENGHTAILSTGDSVQGKDVLILENDRASGGALILLLDLLESWRYPVELRGYAPTYYAFNDDFGTMGEGKTRIEAVCLAVIQAAKARKPE